MVSISSADIDAAYKYANRSLSRTRRDPEHTSGGILHKALETAEVLAGAGAVGFASGRFGPLNLGNTPVPLDLVGGIGAHLIAFWMGGRAAPHIHNVADGALAAYFTKYMVGVGTSFRMKAGLPPVQVSGANQDDREDWSRKALYGRAQGVPAAWYGGHGMPGYSGAGVNVAGAAPLTEAELAGLAQQMR